MNSILRKNNLQLQWARIPAGSFWMGGIAEDKFVSSVELPRHKVTLQRPLHISRHPVTTAQWLAVMGSLPAFNNPAATTHPVVGVSWQDAGTYCEKLAEILNLPLRLPSEAEWEYTCRAGSESVFPHGNHIDPSAANYLYDELGIPVGPGKTTPVGTYGTNAFGAADMLGNICEWTADSWLPGFENTPTDGSPATTPHTRRRVIRGGAWDHLPRVLRASWRDWAPESARWDNLGFRVATDASPQ